MDKSLQSIRQYTERKQLQNDRDIKHAALVDSNLQTQQVIVRVVSDLVDFLDNRISKTEIVNQLEQIGTPDAYAVVEAVNSLHQTLASRNDVDLTEVTNLLGSVLDEARKIPKSVASIDIPEPIDHTEQFKNLETAIKSLEDSVKAQDLHVEAPVVNVPETVVNVEKPDLDPLTSEQEKTRKELVRAFKAIVIPETDLTKLEKESKVHTKLLKEIRDRPVSSGGGGGGRATPYENNQGMPQFVTLEADSSIPVTIKADDSGGSSGTAKPTDAYALSNIDDSTATEYYGYEDKDGNWYIKRFDSNAFTFVKGSSNYSTAWTNRASQSYASYGSTF